MLDNETAQRSRLAIFRERGLVTARWKRCWKRDPFDDRLGFVKGFHAHRSSCVFRYLCSKTILLVRNIHALRKWENGRKHRSIDGSIITSSRFSRLARNTGGLTHEYSDIRITRNVGPPCKTHRVSHIVPARYYHPCRMAR